MTMLVMMYVYVDTFLQQKPQLQNSIRPSYHVSDLAIVRAGRHDGMLAAYTSVCVDGSLAEDTV